MVDFLGHQFGLGDSPSRSKLHLDLVHDDRRKVFEIIDLGLIDRPRFLVDDTQRAKIMTVARGQRNTP